MIEQIILIAYVVIGVILITLILLHKSKGADVGASFGGGSSQTMLAPSSGSSGIVRVIAVLSLLFFIGSLSLSSFVKARHTGSDIVIPTDAEVRERLYDETPSAPPSGNKATDIPSVPTPNQTK